MAKGRARKKPNTNFTSLFRVVLFLVQYTLFKIGQSAILLTQVLIRSLFSLPDVHRGKKRSRLLKIRKPHLSRGGKTSLLVVNKSLDIMPAIVAFLSKAKLPHYHPPKFSIFNSNNLPLAGQFSILPFRRGRGRPRKTPLFPFYLSKFKHKLWLRIPLKFKITTALLVGLLTIFAYTSFILTAAYQLPTPQRLTSFEQPLTTQFYDRNGKLLYRLYEGRNRTLVKLDELPKHLVWATVSTEDKNFYRHIGLEPMSILRALYQNIRYGRKQGASTITQQLVKNSLLTSEKTYIRKIKEVILAFWAERKFTKDEILEMYFNQAPYGGPAWGIEAAAQTYFGKSARDLTLSESAFLAGLPASPTRFSPYGSQPELAKIRQAYVLDRMVKEGYINEVQKQAALNEPLALKTQTNNILAPHFVFYVRDLLSQEFGPRVVSQGGLKIQTTLDLDLQTEAERIVSEEIDSLARLGVKNGAAMVLDAKTGQILAMVGSRDYYYPGFGNFNVTLSLRQPGSSIKVVTYATAFKKGFSPGNTILDSPVSFNDGIRVYSPVNYDGTFHGPVSIRTALGSSYNVPAVKMLAAIGIPDMIQTARDLGITTFNEAGRFGLSLTLGGGEVTMLQMMGVYGTLSQLGRLNNPTPILKVTDSAGNVLEEYKNSSKQAIQAEIAYLLTSILSDNKARTPAFGPNSLLNITGQAVAVKTGTSDNKRDNWTFGYTKDFVVGTWVGNNDNSPMHPSLTSGVTGAAPIWRKITDLLLKKSPSAAFVKPFGIVEGTIDGRRDLVISSSIPKGLVRVRRDQDKVIFRDAFSAYATSSATAAIKDGVNN